jgi:hypothetical protein
MPEESKSDRIEKWKNDYAEIYVEQPLDERVYNIVEDFVQQYSKRIIELKKEGESVKYSPPSIRHQFKSYVKFKSFNSCVAYLVAVYIEASDRVRTLSSNMKPEYVTHGSTELFLVQQDAYRDWRTRLADSAENLLLAIQYANGHKLVEDGSQKQIESLTIKNQEIQHDLDDARRRILSLETYMRIHNLNPDDAADTIVSGPDQE